MNKLELRVLLSAVDRITAPLKKMRDASGVSAAAIKATQDKIKQLNKQAGQIDGYRTVSRQLGMKSAALVKAQREVARLAQEMAASSAPSKELTRNFERARAETARLVTQQKNLTISQHRQREALRSAGIDTRNLASHQRQLSRELASANQQLQQQKTRLERVAQQQKQLAQARQRYDQTMALRSKLAGSGATMLATGAAAGYAGTRVLQPGLNFGEQMSELQAIARLNKDSTDYALLKQQARDLGASTAFTATDVGAAQTFLARAGITPKAIHASMQDVLNLALANKTDLAATADIASNIGGVFKIDAAVEGNMRRIADVLSGTAARANVDLLMLGETMKYLGGVEELGMSIEQAAAMAGIMGNIGIQGSMAGTTARSMVNRLTKPAKEAIDVMKELGLQVTDSAGNMRQLPDILKDLNQLTREFGSADKKNIMQTIFGAEAGSGAAELTAAMGNGQLTKLLSELENLKINPGESAKMAAVMADNINGDLKSLRSAWEDVGIAITEVNETPLRELIRTVTDITRKVGQWAQANPELVAKLSKVAAIVIGLSVVGGTLSLTIAGLLGPLAMLKLSASVLGIKALPGLSAAFRVATGVATRFGAALMATPVGWIVAGIAAVALAALTIYKYWEPIKAFFAGVWQGITDGLAPVIETLSPAFAAFAELLSPLKPLWNGIADALGAVWNWVTQLLQPFEATKEHLDAATGAGQRFGKWLADMIMYLPNALVQFHQFGSELINGMINGITGKLGELKESITGAASSAIGWFKDVLGIRSPSRVFAAAGDDTMAGLTLGINRSQQHPVKAITGLSKELTAASFVIGISALPLPALEQPSLIDHQRASHERLIPKIAGTRHVITEELVPTAIPEIANAQRIITEQLRPAKLADIPEAGRIVREKLIAEKPAAWESTSLEVSSPFTAAAGQGVFVKHPQNIHIDASLNAPITIYAQPGMNERDIARLVSEQLAKREREQQARLRSSLRDLE